MLTCNREWNYYSLINTWTEIAVNYSIYPSSSYKSLRNGSKKVTLQH